MNNGDYQPSSDLHPNVEYLGTVISFNPDGSDVEVMARGLRNVYNIAFDQDGNLFGAENDGRTARSKQWHTLYNIVEDGYYGFPEYGTFDGNASDEELQTGLWVLDGTTPVGVETTDKIGYEEGVLVGLRRKVVFVPVAEDKDGLFVPGFMRPEPTIVDITDGLATIVQADPEGLLEGTGKAMRHVKIRSMETLEDPSLAELVRAAEAHARS
jgi:glucose/arabinose dehydrogenase